jgi:16S rRNA (guanine(966)-N(2))-methyltransferase RsmD
MTDGKRGPSTPRQVRIIGGRWKRTPLPVADLPGLRPSPDRVRETLFNWLAHLVPDIASLSGLDLFAGTGALGYELASRGARSVLLVESNAQALEALRTTQSRLDARQVEIVAGDAIATAARLPAASFDIVFLDPPFDGALQAPALAAAHRLLAPDGLIYLEAPAALTAQQIADAGLAPVRAARAGKVAFHLLRLASA